MRKFICAGALLFFISSASVAQDAKRDPDAAKTKMDAFTSKTGVITKFIDYKLPSLKSTYGRHETRIRKIGGGTLPDGYFYQIEKENQYTTAKASIEYSDLLEVIKALASLKAEVVNDLAANPDYLENKFITTDGFQVGYFVSKGKVSWYIKLERFGSDNTIFIDDVSTIETALNEAKAKIEQIKK